MRKGVDPTPLTVVARKVVGGYRAATAVFRAATVREWVAIRRELFHNRNGFHADSHHLAYWAENIAGIVFTVGIGVALDLVLVDDPFECGARVEAVVESLRRDAGEKQGFIELERLLVSAELHFSDALGVGDGPGFDNVERPGVDRFVVDMEMGELASGVGECGEVRCEGSARADQSCTCCGRSRCHSRENDERFQVLTRAAV